MGRSIGLVSTVVVIDPEIHGGNPVFAGTRVPVESSVEYLRGGSTTDEFIDHFPSVRREQAVSFLREAAKALVEHADTMHERGSDRA